MTSPPPNLRWYQFRLKSLLVAFLAVSILFAYVGSYYRVSQRGMDEARRLHSPGFLYITVDELTANQSYTRHYRIATFYAPANLIDYYLFGGMTPIAGGTLRLVGDDPAYDGGLSAP